ncbi:hypothetical protein [Kordiimonas gwangyangensis]|uniref:hypothetical protein n=1 Tax=Kordiimonas gwangyangensis TaxID=288022 RepID=UPI000B22D871|nr:hypothetical protein [Kordiimonas gwangyangensis]
MAGLWRPILLLVLLVSAVLPQVYGKGLAASYGLVKRVTPWTVLFWLVTAVFVELSPYALPSPSGGFILFAIWLARRRWCLCTWVRAPSSPR